MQLWFAHRSTVTLREQLVTQVVLGILSDDLRPGQRLPSTRDLARRFRLHPNTVSAGYRQLQRERWVEFRRGSGVYIRSRKSEEPPSSAFVLDQLIANLFRSARELGAPLSEVQSRLSRWLAMQPPDYFLLIERHADLRRIIVAEMQRALKFPVVGAGLDTRGSADELKSAIPVVLAGNVEKVRQALPRGTELLELHYRSVPSSLDGWLPVPSDALIGIVSVWPGFLKIARTMLTAAGFHADSMVFRDARDRNWERGLKQMSALLCDSVTASRAPNGSRVISFSLLSESSLQELKRYEQFIRHPLAESL